MNNLIIFDLLNNPIGIGDIFQAMYLYQLKYNDEKLSVCLYIDENVKESVTQATTLDNIYYYIPTVIDIVNIFSFVNDIFISKEKKIDGYNIVNNDFKGNFKEIQEILNKEQNKQLPLLKESIMNNCEMFFKEFFNDGYIPIITVIRISEARPERNSSLESFRLFFNKAFNYNRYYKFILTGSDRDHNIFKRYFKDNKNIVFTKDYFNLASFDLILSFLCPFLLGTKTGIATSRRYTDKPFLIVDYCYSPYEMNIKEVLTNEQKFIFRKYKNNYPIEQPIDYLTLFYEFKKCMENKNIIKFFEGYRKILNRYYIKNRTYNFANLNFF